MSWRRVVIAVRRKIKLMRTAPHREKMLWGAYVLIVVYGTLVYMKGLGLFP